MAADLQAPRNGDIFFFPVSLNLTSKRLELVRNVIHLNFTD